MYNQELEISDLKDLELYIKKFQDEEKIGLTDKQLDELIKKIYSVINVFTKKGDLEKVYEVCSLASKMFYLAAEKTDQLDVRQKAILCANLMNDKANLEKVSKELRVDLNVIESCSFKSIFINGKRYSNDVIIFPDRVKDKWWRTEGHKLSIDDIKIDLESDRPEVFIVGTGIQGKLDILPETIEFLKSSGIELIAEKTEEAYKTYNRLSQSKKVVAAFHLAC